MFKLSSFLVFLVFIPFSTALAQLNIKKDTSYKLESPITLSPALLITGKSLGLNVQVSKILVLKEKHKLKKNKSEKVKIRPRILSASLIYYYQKGLHHNWMLLGGYTFRSINKKGLFADFIPLLGVSRTFLSDETYTVNDLNIVERKIAAGNWYGVTGFNLGGGKQFNATKNHFFKEINFYLVAHIFYPNFKFIAFRPSFQLGTSIPLNKNIGNTKKNIKYK